MLCNLVGEQWEQREPTTTSSSHAGSVSELKLAQHFHETHRLLTQRKYFHPQEVKLLSQQE